LQGLGREENLGVDASRQPAHGSGIEGAGAPRQRCEGKQNGNVSKHGWQPHFSSVYPPVLRSRAVSDKVGT
jgi:hypothetical protein